MKKSIFFLAAFATFMLALVSCQKETQTEAPALATKRITLTDKSGENSATILLTAADESLLNETDWSKVIEIEPVFDRPNSENALQQPGEVAAGDETEAAVHVEVESQNLQAGAVGVAVKVQFADGEGATERASVTVTFQTAYDGIAVYANYLCHKVKYSKKTTSSSTWSTMGTFNNVCPPYYTVGYSANSYRMRAQVTSSTSASYTVVYFN